ncbi:MAG: hypothetical protein JXN61_02995 [Sedimentisphaerales bacterium]|nr:hypothetical protein [Sedimentisphaerales bacterium]
MNRQLISSDPVNIEDSSNDSLTEEQKKALESVLEALRSGDRDKVLRLFLKDQARNLFPENEHTLKWLVGTIGKAAATRLVVALATLPCFNCKSGLLECDNCNDGGRLENEFVCESCLGLGRIPCDFCGGTGLASVDFIPLGLRLAVFAVRIQNAEKRLLRLIQLPMPSAQSAVRAFHKRADLLFALNREISVLETAVGVTRDYVNAPRNLKGRITRIANEAVRIARKSEKRLTATVKAMLGASSLSIDSYPKGSNAHKLAVARTNFLGALLDSDPQFKGTYLEHKLLNETAEKLFSKKTRKAKKIEEKRYRN